VTRNLLEPNSKKGIDYYDTIHDQKLKSLRYTRSITLRDKSNFTNVLLVKMKNGNFSVVSVLAFPLPTPGRGAVAVTKDHKKSAALWHLITPRLGTIISTTMLGTTHKKWRGVRFRMGGAFSNFNNFFLIQIMI
jgi:hypothetical protein